MTVLDKIRIANESTSEHRSSKNYSPTFAPLQCPSALSSTAKIGKARKIEETQNDYFLIFRTVLIVQEERQVNKRVEIDRSAISGREQAAEKGGKARKTVTGPTKKRMQFLFSMKNYRFMSSFERECTSSQCVKWPSVKGSGVYWKAIRRLRAEEFSASASESSHFSNAKMIN